MEGVRVTVLTIAVIVQTGENDGTAGRAGSGGGECVGEARALGGEGIKVRRLNIWTPVATCDRALIVGDKENDVRLRRSRSKEGEASGEEEDGEGETGHLADKRVIRIREVLANDFAQSCAAGNCGVLCVLSAQNPALYLP